MSDEPIRDEQQLAGLRVRATMVDGEARLKVISVENIVDGFTEPEVVTFRLPGGVYTPTELAPAGARAWRLLVNELRTSGIRPTPEILQVLADYEAEAAGAPISLVVDRPAERWLPVSEAARRRGCSPEWIRALARSGRIRARRPGWVWEIAEAAVPAASSERNSVGTNSEPGAA